MSNVMELEERFGTAKKTMEMSMSQWFGHIRDLASRLWEVRTILPLERVANRMLNGLGPEWDNVKWALKVRSSRLTVELVMQHLLAAEAERKKVEISTAPTVNTSYQGTGRQIQPGSIHGPTATSMPVTIENHNQHFSSLRTSTSTPNYRSHLYSRPNSLCSFCKQAGHNEDACWTKYPELKSRWMIEKEE